MSAEPTLGNVMLHFFVYALLLVAGLIAGYSVAEHRGSSELARMQSAKDVCTSTATDQQAAIKKLQGKLAEQARISAAQQHVAQAAMAARDQLQRKLQTEARKRADLVRRVSHETPNCASLAVAAVCPAVSERLWPDLQAIDATTSH